MSRTTIEPSEYADRRTRVLRDLAGATGVICAGDATGDAFQAHAHFQYLVGLGDEPGAILLLDPRQPLAHRRVLLFLKARDPELEQWEGWRPAIGGPLRKQLGIDGVFRLGAFPRWLAEAARRSGRLACLHAFAPIGQPVSPDLAIFRQVTERIPGLEVTDCTMLVPKLRSTKSSAEIALMTVAAQITARAYEELLPRLRSGQTEFDVQEMLEHVYKLNGARGAAYPSIVGGGLNSTVLHYRANRCELKSGELVCIDSAARFDGYCADVTRTLPVSGRFSARQRQVYDVVLAAQAAAIRAVRPGATLAKIDAAARRVIRKAGFEEFFIHGIGHHLGLEVHEPAAATALGPGAVVTIEPGIYLPDEALGVRIEDDVLVTRGGCRVLTAAIPKDADELERRMQRSARSRRRKTL
ncbi:MAG: aminopeptidase P N-terminal domain-containing protein [Planctomycetota bacterium]